ncbi:MAG TPA: C-terminal binding protein [Methylomirabilota bacterium]|jgi:D-3-phosphoglycerate dehydrogenase
MRDGRRLIANIGSLLEGAKVERERIAAAGATLVEARGGTEDELVATCADAEVVVGLGQFPFTARVFESLPRLELLMQCTVGYDQVDVAAATRHGVLVANSPFFCIEEVSDHAAMLLLACTRKLPHQVHAFRRHGWSRPPAVEAMGSVQRMRGQTLGFVGFGKIARLTAEKLAGFRMHYLAYDPYLTAEAVRPWNVELVSLDELCRRSDFISMHALLNAGSRRVFGAAQFQAMKPTAYFVNTSRGGTVDEAAMIQALREGRIAGAAVDVLEQEPPHPDNPLLTLPNVLLTAHTAGHGDGSMTDNRRQSVDQVLRFLGGQWPTALVNQEVKAHARAHGLRDG